MVRAPWTSLVVLGLVALNGCGVQNGPGPRTAESTSAAPEADLAPPRSSREGATSDPVASAATADAPADAAPATAGAAPAPYAVTSPPAAPLHVVPPQGGIGPGEGGDKYAFTPENDFLAVKDSPLSTFSID